MWKLLDVLVVIELYAGNDVFKYRNTFYCDNTHIEMHWPSRPIKKQKQRRMIQTHLTL